MADVHGSPASGGQMPGAMTPGPAPVPYSGPDQAAEPPGYGAGITVPGMGMGAGADVMLPVPAGNAVQESGYAHDLDAGLVTPYYAGDISPIQVHGDADAGGRDDVSGTVAGAVANAEARFMEHAADTYAQGSTIGDIMTLPPSPLDPGVGSTGTTDPSGGYFDPPRTY